MAVLRTFDLSERYKEIFPKDDVLYIKHNGARIKFSNPGMLNTLINSSRPCGS
jgi:hypothetical protein